LHTILARRPRLALKPSEAAPVLEWLQQAHTTVARDAPDIVSLLRARA